MLEVRTSLQATPQSLVYLALLIYAKAKECKVILYRILRR